MQTTLQALRHTPREGLHEKMSLITNFINGLKKSFSGNQYTRKLNKCAICGKDSFFNTCLSCEMDEAYKGK